MCGCLICFDLKHCKVFDQTGELCESTSSKDLNTTSYNNFTQSKCENQPNMIQPPPCLVTRPTSVIKHWIAIFHLSFLRAASGQLHGHETLTDEELLRWLWAFFKGGGYAGFLVLSLITAAPTTIPGWFLS